MSPKRPAARRIGNAKGRGRGLGEIPRAIVELMYEGDALAPVEMPSHVCYSSPMKEDQIRQSLDALISLGVSPEEILLVLAGEYLPPPSDD